MLNLVGLAADGHEGVSEAIGQARDLYLSGEWDTEKYRKEFASSLATAIGIKGAPGSADLDWFDAPDADDDFEGMTKAEREAKVDADADEAEVLSMMRRDRLREEARRRLAEENAAGRPSVLDSFMTLADMDDMPEPEPLVGTLLGRGQTAMIVAESNTGKTFLTVAMAHAVATGVPFAGHEAHQGRVLFAIGEDESGMRARLKAVQVARGPIENDAIDFLRVPFNLDDERAVTQIEERVRIREYALIVLDPLARFLVDMEENDQTAMNKAMATLDRLRRASDQASIVIAHHTNKGGGYRGSSAIFAAMDTVVGMKKGNGDTIALSLDKSKSSATGDLGVYRLTPVADTGSVILDKASRAEAREVAEMPSGKADELLQMFARQWPSDTTASRSEVLARASELQITRSAATVNRAIAKYTASGHLEYVPGTKNIRITDKGLYYIEAIRDAADLNP